MPRTRPGKARIEKALLSLLEREPLHDISVSELCAVASISHSAFYANVHDLYVSSVRELMFARLLSTREQQAGDGHRETGDDRQRERFS